MGFVPYVIPGFGLAKLAAEVFERQARRRRADPAQARHLHVRRRRARGLRAHDRARVARRGSDWPRAGATCSRAAALPKELASAAEVAPIIRGAVAVKPAAADGEPKRFVLDFRTSPRSCNYVDGADLADYRPARRGDARPRHSHQEQAAGGAGARARASWTSSQAPSARRWPTTAPRYDAMFARENARVGGIKTKLDPMPRVVLVPGVGLFGIGATAKDAAIAADLAETAITRHHRCRGHRPLRAAARGRPVRRRILEPGAGQAARARWPSRSRARWRW